MMNEGWSQQPTGGEDRRTTARFAMLEYALIRDGVEGSPVRSVVIDVSLGGLQVRSREQFDEGSSVVLRIGRMEESPLMISASVKYSRPLPETDLYSTGLSVLPASPEERIEWADYVHSIFQNRAEELA